MKVIRGLHGLKLKPSSSVVTIGVFDGVHRGHAAVIRRAVARARELGLTSVIITFDPHPAKIISRRPAAPSLISLDHRIRLIREFSPDILVVISFTGAIASLSAGDFAAGIIAERAGAREVYVGENFFFGKGASAGARELSAFGRRHGFGVHIVKALKVGASRVSSSRIRKLITGGRLAEAARYLGRPVSVLGTVVSGANLARRLGYPTANLNPHHEVIPPGGVYAVLVKYGGRTFKGVLNIGLRPTFYAPRDREVAIEVHIFGFKGKIYGRDLEVCFIGKIRNERKFAGREALIRQIQDDEKAALGLLKKAGRS